MLLHHDVFLAKETGRDWVCRKGSC